MHNHKVKLILELFQQQTPKYVIPMKYEDVIPEYCSNEILLTVYTPDKIINTEYQR